MLQIQSLLLERPRLVQLTSLAQIFFMSTQYSSCWHTWACSSRSSSGATWRYHAVALKYFHHNQLVQRKHSLQCLQILQNYRLRIWNGNWNDRHSNYRWCRWFTSHASIFVVFVIHCLSVMINEYSYMPNDSDHDRHLMPLGARCNDIVLDRSACDFRTACANFGLRGGRWRSQSK